MAQQRALAALLLAAAALVGAEAHYGFQPEWRVSRPGDPAWLSFQGAEPRFFAEPAPGGELIAFVGGSTTAGYPYPGAGFPEWTGRELARCGRADARVLNRGVGSYGTLREDYVLSEALARRPRFVVLEGGHNEVQELMLYRSIPALLRGPVGRLLAGTALGTHLARALAAPRYGGPMKGPWGLPVDLAEPKPDEVEGPFEARLREMVREIKEAGARPVICVAPVNFRFRPTLSASAGLFNVSRSTSEATSWIAAFASAQALRAAGRPERARELLSGLPRTQQVVWLLASCEEDLGHGRAAASLFREARDPYISSEAMREAQRRVAREEGALLVDLEKAFSAGDPEGLPQARYFVDSHHLSELGYRVAGRELAAALSREEPAPRPCPAAWDGREDGMLQRELGLPATFDSAPLALLANEYSLYAETSGEDPWFRRRAVESLVAALKLDRKGALAKLRFDAPTVSRTFALADAELKKR